MVRKVLSPFVIYYLNWFYVYRKRCVLAGYGMLVYALDCKLCCVRYYSWRTNGSSLDSRQRDACISLTFYSQANFGWYSLCLSLNIVFVVYFYMNKYLLHYRIQKCTLDFKNKILELKINVCEGIPGTCECVNELLELTLEPLSARALHTESAVLNVK